MRTVRLYLLCCLAISVALVSPTLRPFGISWGGASAQAAEPDAPPPPEPLLFLGALKAGKPEPRLSAAVRDSLARAGERLLPDKLVPAERTCSNAECLAQLGAREGARLVVTVKAEDSGPGSQYLTALIYDTKRRVPHDEYALCDRCAPELLVHGMNQLITRSLTNYRSRLALFAGGTGQPAQAAATQAAQTATQVAPTQAAQAAATQAGPAVTQGTAAAQAAAQAAVPTPTTPVATTPGGELTPPAPEPKHDDFFAKWPKNRKIAAVVLGGLLVATLIPTIALHATDNSETGMACGASRCVLKNSPLYIPGYAISGALAVGLGLTFAWPTPKK